MSWPLTFPGIGVLAVALWPGALAGGEAAEHWAFRPPVRPGLPQVKRPDLARNEIDLFVEEALERKGLTLGPEASREVLVRRVAFDLTGLPPSPAEVGGFLADAAPDAYERMVERYLASPRHGERWGRHWLDAAGYADSNGYFSADSERPLAWKYRDWVVRSINADKRFDRFIEEQIAGDELASFDTEGDLLPDAAELLTATHFLRNAQDGTGESDGNEVEVLVDKVSVIEGTVQIIGSSLLGLTLQCARCHDHKFDPISQAEYYGLQAIFSPAYSVRKWKKPADRIVTVGTRAEREAHARAVEKVEREIKARQASLEGFAAPLRRLLQREKAATLPDAERAEVERALDGPVEKRTEEQKALLKKHEKLLAATDEDLAKRFGELSRVQSEVTGATEKLERDRPPPLERISVLVDEDPDPPPHRVLNRGLVTDPGDEVAPGVPAVLCAAGGRFTTGAQAGPGKSSGRRLAFARWLTSERNPLVLRVTANRIWQHHFGTGIVSTPDNFGSTGSRPTHPELLDHLATELPRNGWSLKALHREILRSAAYRQSGATREEGMAADPENRLLWKFPARRLDAEALRDAMLAVSGELDERRGGPCVPTAPGEDGQVAVDEKRDGAFRRAVYLAQRRTQPLAMLEVFDAPLIVTSCTRRSLSTTPLQSLAMLNSAFALARAKALAARIERIAREAAPASGAAPAREERVARAFQLALGRLPSAAERSAGLEFLALQAGEYDGEEAPVRALEDLCQMILASNAFLYVD